MSIQETPRSRPVDPHCAPAETGCPRGDAAIGDLQADIQPAAARVYRLVLKTLQDEGVPFLVGGAFALAYYTGIRRGTKDLDLFLRPSDIDACMGALRDAGLTTEVTFSHWLGKAKKDGHFVDLIFSSGNGCAEVSDAWFEHATEATVLGRRVLLSPPEEIIWSKAYVMERDRYDGADVAHLLLACGPDLDWDRLLRSFGEHWRVLLSHLVMFPFIYPGATDRIPHRVIEDLSARLLLDEPDTASVRDLCRGPLLSRWQYQVDLEEWGYRNALLPPRGRLTREEVETWTAEEAEEE